MKYVVDTKYNKGDIVYSIGYDRQYANILRLLVIGVGFNKNQHYKEVYSTYLCVLCDKDGKPLGKRLDYYDNKAKVFLESELYSSLEEIIDEKNINIESIMPKDECIETRQIYGDDVLQIEFPKEEKEINGCNC